MCSFAIVYGSVVQSRMKGGLERAAHDSRADGATADDATR